MPPFTCTHGSMLSSQRGVIDIILGEVLVVSARFLATAVVTLRCKRLSDIASPLVELPELDRCVNQSVARHRCEMFYFLIGPLTAFAVTNLEQFGMRKDLVAQSGNRFSYFVKLHELKTATACENVAATKGDALSWRPLFKPGVRFLTHQAKIVSFTFPATSVRRKSRPE